VTGLAAIRKLTIAVQTRDRRDTARPLLERVPVEAVCIDGGTADDTRAASPFPGTPAAPAKLGNRSRLLRFIATGSACFAAQYVVLHALLRLGVGVHPAAFVGYASSAQLNFALSYRLTWSDAPRRYGRALAAMWLSFNSVVLVAGLANSFVYGEARNTVADLIALGLAQATSLAITFTVNHFVVMRQGGS
jgi:putative flippase GtrA